MPVLSQSKYESDQGTIHPIKMSADYLAQAGTAPTGDIDNRIKPKISKNNREYGLRPRGVILSRTVGTAPDTAKKYAFLPVLTATAFAGTTYEEGATITIGSTAWTVVSKQSEDY